MDNLDISESPQYSPKLSKADIQKILAHAVEIIQKYKELFTRRIKDPEELQVEVRKFIEHSSVLELIFSALISDCPKDVIEDKKLFPSRSVIIDGIPKTFLAQGRELEEIVDRIYEAREKLFEEINTQ